MKQRPIQFAAVLSAILVLFLLGGCASFSTTIRPIGVSRVGDPAIPLRVGIREAGLEEVRTGIILVSGQPAVQKALKNSEQVRSDLTKAFTDYCKEANLFTECVGEPFDISQVDLELRPELKRLNSNSTYGAWFMVNLVTFDIPAFFGWPYQNNADCEFTMEVRSADGEISKSYRGTGTGRKNTNIYALIFGLREVPHAMESINRCVTAAFESASQQLIAEKQSLIQGQSREAQQ